MEVLTRLLVIIFSLFIFQSYSQPKTGVTLPQTSQITLSSEYGQEYKIYISLPPGYDDSNKSYPVIYVLDADLTFGIVYNTRVLMSYGEEIPEVILVGIAYKEGFENIHNRRFRDFTPTRRNENEIEQLTGIRGINNSGGAHNFLDFIQHTVKNYIQNSLRINTNDETLVGYSLSGLFATYVASLEEKHFNKYLIASPSLWWFGEDLPSFSLTDTGLQIYLSIGSKENPDAMLNPWKKIQSQLKSANIKIYSEILDKDTHVTAFNKAFPNGIRTLFNDKMQQ
ncbi:alpha/beta hydrolase [Spongiimicrobium sp. 3-5]|uniref:alpha/beta hydrolase n=1 Tax=Spongiimicrobium sp. 3-5 TaxID=3332596 RepID=UPI00397EAC33